MNRSFTIGAVIAWLLVSLIYGQLLPVLSLPSIIAVVTGGIIGMIVDGVRSSTHRRGLPSQKVVGETAPSSATNSADTKKCPACAEEIKLEALVCRFCGHKFCDEEIEGARFMAREAVESARRETENEAREQELRRLSRSAKAHRIPAAICFALALGLGVVPLVPMIISFVEPGVLRNSDGGIVPRWAFLIFALIFGSPPGVLSFVLFRSARKIEQKLSGKSAQTQPSVARHQIAD